LRLIDPRTDVESAHVRQTNGYSGGPIS
jgi:hypothetical protein